MNFCAQPLNLHISVKITAGGRPRPLRQSFFKISEETGRGSGRGRGRGDEEEEGEEEAAEAGRGISRGTPRDDLVRAEREEEGVGEANEACGEDLLLASLSCLLLLSSLSLLLLFLV